MYNFYDKIVTNPDYFRQLRCGESLTTIFNCPLKSKYEDAWSHYNYIVCVMEGRKIWHTANGSYELHKGSCVLVRKGACIVEQFFDATFCIVFFFIPDEFICRVLKCKSTPIHESRTKFNPIIPIDNNFLMQAFFNSMVPYFDAGREPDQALLELKFRELVLMVADNPANTEIISFFCSLLQNPRATSLERVMEDNFCFNLKPGAVCPVECAQSFRLQTGFSAFI